MRLARAGKIRVGAVLGEERIVAALCFGLFGPVDGIETIDLD